MIYPYLLYCSIFLASTYKTNLRHLVTLQKRVIRIIDKTAFDAPLDLIFKEHRMLKFYDIRLLELGKLMYSYKNSLLSSKFRNTFLLNIQTHNYNTRNADAFRLPFCRTNPKQYQGSK